MSLFSDPVGESLLEPAYLDGIEKMRTPCDPDTVLTACPVSPDVPPTSTPGLPSGTSPHVQQQIAFMEIQAQVRCQYGYIDGMAHNCCNSSVNALELLQSCAKPVI